MTITLAQSVMSFLQMHAPQGAMLQVDSRKVKPGDVFLAFPGDSVDGRNYIAQALKQGASAVLAEAADLSCAHPRIFAVNGLKQLAGDIAHSYYGVPSNYLPCVGVTGTNGKTTSVQWIAQLIEMLSQAQCAVVGTLGAGLYRAQQQTGFTTPQACDLHHIFAQCYAQGAVAAAVEVSSIGVVEGRLNGAQFRVAAFTNLTQDHLDYHGTMDAYAQAKQTFFTWSSLHTAVINLDDPFGQHLNQWLAKERPHVKRITLSLSKQSSLYVSQLKTLSQGQQSMNVHVDGNVYEVVLPALGTFNVLNMLTAVACAWALGFDIKFLLSAVSLLKPVMGRMQVLNTATKDQPLVLVDYAHTPDGLEQLLLSAREVALQRGGQVQLVFGCGGNRDTSKRSKMGKIAADYAHKVVITNDNPRNEDPMHIAQQILQGAPDALVCLDRAQAIERVILKAHEKDLVVIAGKGHESTQTVGTVVAHFSDIECALDVLSRLKQSHIATHALTHAPLDITLNH